VGSDPTGPPPTRWALAGGANAGYARTFGDLVAGGHDVDGEARLADALAPRGARVLDVGSGMGRVAAALTARGHHVVAVEPDAALVAQSRRTYPDLAVIERDVLALDTATLADRGRPTEFDLVVCVGNVLAFLAEGTERRVLAHLASLLAPGGRVLAGFHLRGGPATARHYPPEELVADAAAAGLRVDLRAGSYELHPANDEYAVWLLSRDRD
jgi:SAM-dependent methyltransferase